MFGNQSTIQLFRTVKFNWFQAIVAGGFNVETESVVFLGSGKGENQLNLYSQKKVEMAQKKRANF